MKALRRACYANTNRVHRVVKSRPYDEVRVAAACSAHALDPATNPRTQSHIASIAASPSEFTRHFESPMLAMVCNDSASSLIESIMFITRLARAQTLRLQQFVRFCNDPCPSPPSTGNALVQSLYFTSRAACLGNAAR